MGETYRYPMAPYNRQNLPQVAQYLAVHQAADVRRDELLEYLRQEMLQQLWWQPSRGIHKESLEALLPAEVGARRRAHDPVGAAQVLAGLPFPIYITAGPSNLLAEALGGCWQKATGRALSLERRSRAAPADLRRGARLPAHEERPLVYHVFGHLRSRTPWC